MYRRHDPTAYRGSGPLRPIDVLSSGLKPGDAVECGPDLAVPALVIGNLADDACTPGHTHRLFEAIGHPDNEMHEIAGANHYYAGANQRDKRREGVGIVTDWLHRHGLSQ